MCSLAMKSMCRKSLFLPHCLEPSGSFFPKDAISLPREVLNGKRKREGVLEQP